MVNIQGIEKMHIIHVHRIETWYLKFCPAQVYHCFLPLYSELCRKGKHLQNCLPC
jgi:hypothetical protein